MKKTKKIKKKHILLSIVLILLFALITMLISIVVSFNAKKITKNENDVVLTIKDNSPVNILSLKKIINKFNKENSNTNLILEIVSEDDELKINSDVYLNTLTAGCIYDKDKISTYINPSNNSISLSDLATNTKKSIQLRDDFNLDNEQLIDKKNIIFNFFSLFVNKDLLFEIFDLNDYEKGELIGALRHSSYDDFKNFISKINSFLTNPKKISINFDNETFITKDYKTKIVKNITGIFSFSKYEEEKKIENILSNFDNTFLTTNSIKNIMNDISLETDNIAGEFDKGLRGSSLTNGNNYNTDISKIIFNDNKALFVYLSSYDYQKISFNYQNLLNKIEIICLKSSEPLVNNKFYIDKINTFTLNESGSNSESSKKVLNFLNKNLKKFIPTFNSELKNQYLKRLTDNANVKLNSKNLMKITSSLLSEKTYLEEFIIEVENKFLENIYE